MKKDVNLFVMLVILLSATNAYAYLDPGTGSYMLQLLLGGAVAVGFGIKNFWRSIVAMFVSNDESKRSDN